MSVLTRAAQILDALAESNSGLSVRELAEATGLPKSSVHRIVQELTVSQYVMAGGRGGSYQLGPGLLKLGLNNRRQFVAPMRKAIATVAREVNENIDLAMLSGGELVIIEQIAAVRNLPTVTVVGRTFALHASSIGKALLSQLPPDQVRNMLPADLEVFTTNTITDVTALLRELDDVRSTGVAFDHEEHDVGISSVAVPLPHPAAIPQAMAIVAPTPRFAQRKTKYVAALDSLTKRANST
ncbi:IclR family transcriptional regulator [Mycobacteroides abscessus]|uniref:IclR family transcriptional regulator n=1 Tax=Mycobacteroides abscessus TaxID=36809 RepID=UPI0009A6D758|nr:IclR family transcriptional regulator [Mycobacteroides abscessus]SKI78359.1 Putative transcriptional regulator, IclR family [Mycobacteroides abscessus subsp. abscessus]SKP91960.1 Putative transcriptional regulator, IclR family [Mycobacteroides abscessus subsp. abscessus]